MFCVGPVTVVYLSHRKGKEREFPQEDPHVQFYENYRKEADEYDRELMKEYNRDLNMTLIFVGGTHCSGAYVLT